MKISDFECAFKVFRNLASFLNFKGSFRYYVTTKEDGNPL